MFARQLTAEVPFFENFKTAPCLLIHEATVARKKGNIHCFCGVQFKVNHFCCLNYRKTNKTTVTTLFSLYIPHLMPFLVHFSKQKDRNGCLLVLSPVKTAARMKKGEKIRMIHTPALLIKASGVRASEFGVNNSANPERRVHSRTRALGVFVCVRVCCVFHCGWWSKESKRGKEYSLPISWCRITQAN